MSNSKAEKSLTKNSLSKEEIEIYKEFYDECDLDSDGFIDKKGS
jgi:Ca2+-binding EF-hand superfamily protein